MEVINVKVASLRLKGWESLEQWVKDPNHLYIGRANGWVKGAEKSKWCNPFSTKKFPREEAVKMYESYIKEKVSSGELNLNELKGKVLGCWCKPELCHGDVLVKMCKETELPE